MLVLASSSPYRRALLERLRLPFEVCTPDVDERPRKGETAGDTAVRLARLKAAAVGARRPGDLIIGCDQVATLDGAQIGKPGDPEAARRQLRALGGRAVEFHTALCLLDSTNGIEHVTNVPTTVTFRPLSDAQIERYLLADRPFDCAGSAKIESLGIALVERVASEDPTALIGLPLIALVSFLQRSGVVLP